MASQVQTSVAWTKARDRYVEDLNEEERHRYFKASPESLLDDALAAEKTHATKSTTRSVMEKLQPFVAAVEQYGQAIDVYSNTYSLALGPIWGSIKVLLHIAREFGKYFDKLVDMFARIGDVIPRYRTYERLFPNHEHLIQALSKAYLDIITFCSDAKAVFRRGQRSSKATLKMTLKLLWKPFDLQFGQQLSAFRRHSKDVEEQAGLANMIEAADARAMMLADQKQLEKRRREDTRLRIVAMLQAVDYEAKHRKLQNLGHAGTGEWLFRQAIYADWETPDNSAFLCCRGIPGCGKSILASNLVDKLVGAVPAPAAPVSDIIYYYCDYADQRTLQLDRILGSLLKQLFLNHQIPEHIETQLLRIYAGGTRSPAEKALHDIFCSSVELLSDIYMVFDGIDECEKSVWQGMLKIFKHLATIKQCNVRIFLTCVEEGPVAHYLYDTPCIQLSPTATAEDIRTFVTSSVRSKLEDGNLRIRNPKLEQDIISELVLRANGMFLWVFFQLDDLCDSSSDAIIRETLNNLPEGLGDTYRRILDKISKSPSRAKLAQKVFQWATVAKRPLHVEELKEAVAFEPDDKSWNVEKVPHEDLMFESCRGLIIKDEDDESVHFAHHTVRQYLTGGLTTKVDPLFEVSVGNADILAGEICVAYLSFSDFETQITSTTPTFRFEQNGVLESGGPLWIPSILGIRKSMFDIPYKLLRGDPALRPSDSDYWKHLRPKPKPKISPSTNLKDKYRLLCYAIEHWEPHTRWYHCSDSSSRRRLETLAKQKTLAFDFRPWGPNQHFGSYGCVGCPSPSADSLVAKDLPYISMIHYAAEVGNVTFLTSHYFTDTEIGDYLYHERYHNETLMIACRHGRTEIVKYLMDQSPFDIADGRAVNAAATAGHVDVLQYLLSLGQYSIKQQGDAALLSAAGNGHNTVVEVLADAGANLDATDQRTGRSVLELAAINGHDSVVRILLRREAREKHSFDPNWKSNLNALRFAAANGSAAATTRALESGFPNDTDAKKRQIVLHKAAESGHSAVAEVLLEYGADPARRVLSPVLFYDDYRLTPFHMAAQRGHVKVLELYKNHIQSVDDPQSNIGKTPLHIAAAAGQDKAVRWLVENGADVNAIDRYDDTPLALATELGDETTVGTLLELGAMVADPSITGYNRPLKVAIKRSDTSILSSLLNKIRDDREILFEIKRYIVARALDDARGQHSSAAIKLLERQLRLYEKLRAP